MLDYMRDRAFPGTDEIINNIDRIENAYNNVINLSKISNNEGILALEFNVDFVKDTRELADDLSWMIHLICDGTDSEIIEEFITNRFLANNYKGIEALIFNLYARGSLYIQEGKNPRVIEELFNSVIPGSINRQKVGGAYFSKESDIQIENNRCRLATIQEEMSDKTRKAVDRIQVLMSFMTESEWNYMTGRDGAAGWDWIVPAVDDIHRIMIDAHMIMGRFLKYLWHVGMPKGNEILEACEDFEAKLRIFRNSSKEHDMSLGSTYFQKLISEEEFIIKAVLSEADNSNLAVALKGCNIPLKDEILKYVENKRKYMIEDGMDSMGPVRVSDVEAALLVLKSIYQRIKEENRYKGKQ